MTDTEVILEKLIDIKTELDDIDEQVQDTHKRLYIDNGRPSIQTRLIQLEDKVQGFVRVQKILGVLVIGVVIRLIYTAIMVLI